NFKINNICHQTSLPNTPIESDHHQQQQFDFSSNDIPATQHEPTAAGDDMLNARNFDLNCLNDSHYSDFMFNAKEIESDFIDDNNNSNFSKQSATNMIPYESISVLTNAPMTS